MSSKPPGQTSACLEVCCPIVQGLPSEKVGVREGGRGVSDGGGEGEWNRRWRHQ